MTIKQQYLPTLLDRLVDDEPRKEREAFDKTFCDSKTYRRLVQRDLEALLNCTNLERELSPVRHADVMQTVLNYGLSPLAGALNNIPGWRQMEKNIRDAILRFEPRIIPQSLSVQALQGKGHAPQYGRMLFEIRGLLYWEPQPVDLCMKGVYDSECDGIELTAG